MIDQLLELELGLIRARLDARKVLPKKSGKRPGKFCKGKSGKGSYIAAEKKCADHETTTPDGKRKLSESGKKSAEELAKKVRERKGMKGMKGMKEVEIESTKPAKSKTTKQKKKSPIRSYSEFSEEIQKELDSPREGKNPQNDLVPIYSIREKLGSRVARDTFDYWLLRMQSDDVVRLWGGEMPDITPKKVENSIKIDLGGGQSALRYYVARG